MAYAAAVVARAFVRAVADAAAPFTKFDVSKHGMEDCLLAALLRVTFALAFCFFGRKLRQRTPPMEGPVRAKMAAGEGLSAEVCCGGLHTRRVSPPHRVTWLARRSARACL
jgi:hypothetical protein